MIFIGDYFALGLVLILSLFFFDSKASLRYMNVYSKLFISALLMIAVSTVVNLYCGYLLRHPEMPGWLHVLANTLYFIVAIITTSLLALYMFHRILEHTHRRDCMRHACVGLSVVFAVYLLIVLLNLSTGWLFRILADGTYVRGPLHSLGYGASLAQLLLVLICFFRNKKNATSALSSALIMAAPILLICTVVHLSYPDISLNAFIMALISTVIFLSFQGQRQGVHTLTKLNDRHRFFFEVNRRIENADPFQVFLINVKDYGAINQKFGNKLGDEILYQFAFSLEKLLPDSITFHMSGTVFAVILQYSHQATAEKQSGVLLDFLEQGIRFSNHQIDLNYFVAHYVSDDEALCATDLYEMMEYAIHKTRQKNIPYVQCGRDDLNEVRRRRYLVERLEQIDRAHGFEVWFQPVKCIEDDAFCSMEALIRLREPDGKLISPGEFIPVAEQTGFISTVTWFVLEDVCRTLKENPALSGISVSINMPQTQLLEKGFVPRFISTVDRAGIEHRRICIEFTERAILENFQKTKLVMDELTQQGFRFFLDDFGVNYSNFNCLLQLPFQVIKLDPCLVHTGADGLPDYTTLHTLTDLFHAMNLVVVAEGAESDEEVQALTREGVDRIQGFALARPMPTDKLLEFYGEHPVT